MFIYVAHHTYYLLCRYLKYLSIIFTIIYLNPAMRSDPNSVYLHFLWSVNSGENQFSPLYLYLSHTTLAYAVGKLLFKNKSALF